MRIFLVLLSFICARVVEGGYYKIRAPPPPPVPPASLHYGPHPPSHHHHSPHPYRIYPPHPPKHHMTPHILPYHPHSRGPHGHVHHKNTAHSREFQRVPNFAQKALYNPWKHFNPFRAPVVKETFNLPPPSYLPSFVKNEDKGPIHTIPAPNLGPADKPNIFLKQNEFLAPTHNHGHSGGQKMYKPEDDLVAVLQHGIHKVNVPHSTGYQVTEDPSLHQPNSDKPSYFAPDPDPSVPAVKVPATSDPHSIPSNGQVPLDVYLQQEADKIAAHQQADNSNSLTAQDLFNLLNYQQGSTVNLFPQLSQPLFQPNLQLYNPGVLLQQDYHGDGLQQSVQHFTPQFQTFNYDERTQQGAYGSNSFPTASMGFQLNTDDLSTSGDLFDDFKDNEVAGNEKEEIFKKIDENEISSRQIESKRKPTDKKDELEVKNQFASTVNHVQTFTPYYTTPTPAQTPSTVQSPKQEKPQEEKPETNENVKSQTKTPNIDTTQNVEIVKPEENFQLQKSIQIYENTGHVLSKELSPKSTRKEGKTARGLVLAEIVPETISNQADVGAANIPFGARLRPKRF
ncbi:uncharacterized protein LOC106668066 isoform X2 [Cimex lectularius]|uniref:Uncharacterized protein n=1 Tax=Cimex lectularius TaxID=79782 RepID=A0A8I6RT67_CIMLE|nr:uncharacterized protein LOC106668066 isoform X2 [Cimex lectularius]